MCGIAGLLSLGDKPVSEYEVQPMCDAMVHRGPNDAGYYVRDGVALGMRRLSIIDLATGHQPVHNEDQSVWVVFNGEIYNFQSLRVSLERQGHRFYTGTDTEVIVHLYEQYGERCVEKMRGMFAFAVWDERQKTLLQGVIPDAKAKRDQKERRRCEPPDEREPARADPEGRRWKFRTSELADRHRLSKDTLPQLRPRRLSRTCQG